MQDLKRAARRYVRNNRRKNRTQHSENENIRKKNNVTDEVGEDYDSIPSYRDMMASTPTRVKYLSKLTIMPEVPDLRMRMYEEMEQYTTSATYL